MDSIAIQDIAFVAVVAVSVVGAVLNWRAFLGLSA